MNKRCLVVLFVAAFATYGATQAMGKFTEHINDMDKAIKRGDVDAAQAALGRAQSTLDAAPNKAKLVGAPRALNMATQRYNDFIASRGAMAAAGASGSPVAPVSPATISRVEMLLSKLEAALMDLEAADFLACYDDIQALKIELKQLYADSTPAQIARRNNLFQALETRYQEARATLPTARVGGSRLDDVMSASAGSSVSDTASSAGSSVSGSSYNSAGSSVSGSSAGSAGSSVSGSSTGSAGSSVSDFLSTEPTV